MPDGFWSTTRPLTAGKVLSKGPRSSSRSASPAIRAVHAGFRRWGRMPRKTPAGPQGRGGALGLKAPSLTLSSRSSFPRNPLDAKMGIPGNTVLEVRVSRLDSPPPHPELSLGDLGSSPG